jgi:iron complex transport system permease protein
MPILTARRLVVVLAGLALALAVAILVCASVGSSGYTILDLLRPAGPAVTNPPDVTGGGMAADMILRVRLPRVLIAVLAGAALAAAGAVFQGILRNPLADPYILGISGGAALGFILASAAGPGGAAAALPLRGAAAFAGSIATVGILVLLSRANGRVGTDPMILNGVVLNTVYLSFILLVQTIVGTSRLHGVMLWMVGNVPVEPYGVVGGLAAIVAIGVAGLTLLGRDLNLIAAGEEVARGLGVEVERTRIVAILLASLITAAVVSVAGLIGFAGLIVPHAARLLFGPDHRLLIPAGAITGGLFLLVADTAARVVIAPTELPVGVLTAICGGPFFIWIYRAKRRKVAFHG